jgi:hypothetical protein
MLVSSCITLPVRSSICDNITTQSVLCEISNKYDIRLEDVGMSLVIINAVSIHEELYTSIDAIYVIEKLLESLNGSITYEFFKEKIFYYTNTFPGLLSTTKNILNDFGINNYITDTDKQILRN